LYVPPAAVPSHVTGVDAGAIVPEVGLAAPSRTTATKQTKLNPSKKLQTTTRNLFIPNSSKQQSEFHRPRVGCEQSEFRIASRSPPSPVIGNALLEIYKLAQ
jgi:hypothetical protein